ncbi:hypothetical protein, conserved [Plasmodium ovale wallikeri]|uniref:Regulator of chromosome condensation n=1 Tax=Plasmodium ovale wallikeri TaxID=864142 RepID=A0A1A8YLI8_PLAOA|nr:hypothetical protein, conserved [Plasmodium ovale wallikeri]
MEKKESNRSLVSCGNEGGTYRERGEDGSAAKIKRRNFSQMNILEQLAMLSKKKKKLTREKETWDVISNISKYSSDKNKETEKKKILICLGNNNFGQLGLEENMRIGLIDFSSLRVSKHHLVRKQKKTFTQVNSISKILKRKGRYNSSSTFNNRSSNSLCYNEMYNDILTKLPKDFSLSTIQRIKEREAAKGEAAKGEAAKGDAACSGEGTGAPSAKEKCGGSPFGQSLFRSTNYLTRNKYEVNAIKVKEKKGFYSDCEYDKKHKEKMKLYDDFLAINDSANSATVCGGRTVAGQSTPTKEKQQWKRQLNQHDECGDRDQRDQREQRDQLKCVEERTVFNPKKINCGKYHSGAVSKTGQVCLWGLNCYGQLGVNPKRSIYTCYKKMKLRVVDKGKGGKHTEEKHVLGEHIGGELEEKSRRCLFARREKTVMSPYMFKLIPLRHFGRKHKVKSISLGSFHTLLLTYDGYVFTFGCNKKSQLGLPNGYNKKISYTSKPFLLPLRGISSEFKQKRGNCGRGGGNIPGGNIPLGRKNTFYFTTNSRYASISHPVVYITCGSYHSAVIDADKRLWVWGWNKFGQVDNSYVRDKAKKKEREKRSHGNLKLLGFSFNLGNRDTHNICKKRREKMQRSNNKNVNIPRHIKIRNHNVLQVSLGKYHSLCLTEDKSVYIWGYLKKRENKKYSFFSCRDGSNYYEDVTVMTKIRCLSNLYISNITSSSTHTVFVAPVKWVNQDGENNVPWEINSCLKNYQYSNKASDRYRNNILLKNEGNNDTFLKFCSQQIFSRGGDNVFYVKYTDLYNLVNFNIRKKEKIGREINRNVYYINKKYHVSNTCLVTNKYYTVKDGMEKKIRTQSLDRTNNAKVENILKPLFLSSTNDFTHCNTLQIFQVAVGKNFAIILTSSPSINKILNKKKIDYINNICSLDVLRNKIPERNIFVIGKSDYNQLILPKNCKYTTIPVYIEKNKLIYELFRRNKKHNFLNLSNKKKYSDQINYNKKIFNLKKYHEIIKKSITKNSLLYNHIDKHKCSLVINCSNNIYRQNSIYCKLYDDGHNLCCNKNKISSSHVQSSSDIHSNNNFLHFNLRKKKNNNDNNCIRDRRLSSLEIHSENPLGVNTPQGKSSTINLKDSDSSSTPLPRCTNSSEGDANVVVDCLARDRDENTRTCEKETYINHFDGDSRIQIFPIEKKNHIIFEATGGAQSSLGPNNDLAEKYSQDMRNYGDVSLKEKNTNFSGKKRDEGTFVALQNGGYPTSSNEGDIDGGSQKGSSEEHSGGEHHRGGLKQDGAAAFHMLREYSFGNKSLPNFDKGETNHIEKAKRSETFTLNESTNYIGDHEHGRRKGTPEKISTFNERVEENMYTFSKRKKKRSSINKKELFRSIILRTIDNLNENFLNEKNRNIKLTKCEHVKVKFKVFKKRHSCLWNYFTYHQTKKRNPVSYNLLQNIVNITLLDIACGDYHSLILLEVDTLT